MRRLAFPPLAAIILTACQDVPTSTSEITPPVFSLVPEVTVTNLGLVGEAKDINDQSQIVGYIEDDPEVPCPGDYCAVLLEQGSVIQLPGLGTGYRYVALGINNIGQIVGWALDGNRRVPVLWERDEAGNYAVDELELLSVTYGWGRAEDINDFGQIVGWALGRLGESFLRIGYLWKAGQMTPIVPPEEFPSLGIRQLYPRAVNSLGQVVGEAMTSSGEYRAFSWEAGAPPTFLELPDGFPESGALDVNDAGQIAGLVLRKEPEGWYTRRAVVWTDGVAEFVGGGDNSTARAINDLGQVIIQNWAGVEGSEVLIDGDPTDLGLIQHQGQTFQLPELGLGPWPGGAESINNRGEAVGSSHTGESGWGCDWTLWTTLRDATPTEEIELLAQAVAGLKEAGTLNEGQARSLHAKLDAASRAISEGNTNAAANVFGAFQNHVQAFVNAGILTEESGTTLIDAAQNAIDQLNG